MLRIRVVQINGVPTSMPLVQDFDERGGSIGRSDSNLLVLPDPDRHVSRMQAEVRHDAGKYQLVDHGGNPTLLNGRPLGKGVSAPLGDGDEIGIAEYTLRVEAMHKTRLFSEGKPAAAAQPEFPAATNGPAIGAQPFAAPPSTDDPFAVFAPIPPKPATASNNRGQTTFIY